MEYLKVATSAMGLMTVFSTGVVTGLCLKEEYVFPTLHQLKHAAI